MRRCSRHSSATLRIRSPLSISPETEKPTSLSGDRRRVNGSFFDLKITRSLHSRTERMETFPLPRITMQMVKPMQLSSDLRAVRGSFVDHPTVGRPPKHLV